MRGVLEIKYFKRLLSVVGKKISPCLIIVFITNAPPNYATPVIGHLSKIILFVNEKKHFLFIYVDDRCLAITQSAVRRTLRFPASSFANKFAIIIYVYMYIFMITNGIMLMYLYCV